MKRWISILTCFAYLITGCSNIFEKASDKEFDEAYLEDARKAIDAAQPDLALEYFDKMSPVFQTRHDIVVLWASAHAQKCGLNFANLLNNVGNIGSAPFLKASMNLFTDVPVFPESCYNAQLKMEELTTVASDRSVSENLLMVFLGLTKLGTYLRAAADQDQDGEMDTGFDACPVAGAEDPGDDELTDLEVRQVISSIGLVVENVIGSVGGLIGADADTAISAIIAQCDSIAPGICNISDPTNTAVLTAPVVLSFRRAIHTSTTTANGPQIGIGACADMALPPDFCCGQ